MPAPRVGLIEFPADDSDRALRFWSGLLGTEPEPRREEEGRGWVTRDGEGAAVGVHERGRGPGDTASLPYVEVDSMAAAVERVESLGGQIIHPGERWTICRDSEGTPFALAERNAAG